MILTKVIFIRKDRYLHELELVKTSLSYCQYSSNSIVPLYRYWYTNVHNKLTTVLNVDSDTVREAHILLGCYWAVDPLAIKRCT